MKQIAELEERKTRKLGEDKIINSGLPGLPSMNLPLSSPRIFLFFRSSNSAICFIKQSEKALQPVQVLLSIAVQKDYVIILVKTKYFITHSL